MSFRRDPAMMMATATAPPLANGDSLREPTDPTALAASSTSPTSALSMTRSEREGLPVWLGYPLSVVLSLALSAVFYSFVPELVGVHFAPVSRSLNEPWQIGALVAWKIMEITFAWGAGLDHFDLMQLSFLANAPYYALLYLFFDVRLEALLLGIVIDLFSLAFPFYLVRPLNYHNNLRSVTTPGTTKELAVDKTIQMYMTVFAASVYSVFLFLSLRYWLPVFMLNNFDEVTSLERAHNAVFFAVVGSLIPIGAAAKDFLFTTSIVYARTTATGRVEFVPELASLSDTIMWNIGIAGYTTRESVLIRRTTLLVLFTAVHSFIRIFGTVEGATVTGAAGWSALWSLAALSTGYSFLYIGDA